MTTAPCPRVVEASLTFERLRTEDDVRRPCPMTDRVARLNAALSGRYAVGTEIGEGGMATVYLAHDLRHDRKVAVKVLRPELGAALGTDRFLAEIKLTAGLQHPNILPLFDSGSADGFLFYVMPYVEGETLRQRLEREESLPVDEAIAIASGIAGALDHAHRHGVVHRDIKPENVLLSDGVPIVADFGIARAVTVAGAKRMTAVGSSLGTPQYMSPEQASGDRNVDARSDIYSLGAVLYELLTGEPPYDGSTTHVIFARLLTERPTLPSALRDAVPESVERAVLKALARSPVDRFASAGEFSEALTSRHAGSTDVAEKSVAVLPFRNMSGSPDDEFFSDGMTEEIINALSQLPDLRVAARTSSFAFKGKRYDLGEVGSKLKVAHVVEGSVRRAGDRLRITARLVEVRDGSNTWSEKYDRVMNDVFAVQDEIAGAIADRLKVALVDGPLVRPSTQNLEAYGLYLKGRAALYRRGLSLLEGRRLFEQALELDPDYAPALAGVSDANVLLDFYGVRESQERAADAEAASRALAIDPDLAEAHNSVGVSRIVYGFDWEGGEASMLRALEINPNYVQARCWYAVTVLSGARGDTSAAAAMVGQAIELDPLAAYPRAMLAWALMAGGLNEESAMTAAEAIACDHASLLPVLIRTMALSRCGRILEAFEVAKHGVLAFGRNTWALAILALVYSQMGDSSRAKAVCDELGGRAAHQYVPALHMATAYAVSGQMDEAFRVLDKGCQDRDPTVWAVRTLDPSLFWSDPRFEVACRCVGIEPFSR